MPFVSSVRGAFSPISKGRRTGSGYDVTGGTITIAGGYRIHTFSYTGGDQAFSTTSAGLQFPLEVYAYAAGGGSGAPSSWGRWSGGGGGGFAGGTFAAAPGNYTVVVGQSGCAGNAGTDAYGGGRLGISWGNGGGGGLTGIFSGSSTMTFDETGRARSILIAGGAGGGGASRLGSNGAGAGNRGGGGGGTTGQDGEAYDGSCCNGKAGTQSGPGAGATANSAGPGISMTGGLPVSHGAGGGGGYYGGGAGAYYEPNSMGGGGGGSGYYQSSTVTSPILTQASQYTPANTGGIYYSAGIGDGATSSPNQAGNPGKLVIRYLI